MSRCFTGDGRSRLWEVRAVMFVYSKILTVVMDTLRCFTGDGRSRL